MDYSKGYANLAAIAPRNGLCHMAKENSKTVHPMNTLVKKI